MDFDDLYNNIETTFAPLYNFRVFTARPNGSVTGPIGVMPDGQNYSLDDLFNKVPLKSPKPPNYVDRNTDSWFSYVDDQDKRHTVHPGYYDWVHTPRFWGWSSSGKIMPRKTVFDRHASVPYDILDLSKKELQEGYALGKIAPEYYVQAMSQKIAEEQGVPDSVRYYTLADAAPLFDSPVSYSLLMNSLPQYMRYGTSSSIADTIAHGLIKYYIDRDNSLFRKFGSDVSSEAIDVFGASLNDFIEKLRLYVDEFYNKGNRPDKFRVAQELVDMYDADEPNRDIVTYMKRNFKLYEEFMDKLSSNISKNKQLMTTGKRLNMFSGPILTLVGMDPRTVLGGSDIDKYGLTVHRNPIVEHVSWYIKPSKIFDMYDSAVAEKMKRRFYDLVDGRVDGIKWPEAEAFAQVTDLDPALLYSDERIKDVFYTDAVNYAKHKNIANSLKEFGQ